MTHDFSKEFFAAYHAAVVEALGADAAQYNAKIGSLLANAWIKRLSGLPADSAEFKKAMEAYMSGPFRFSDIADLTFDGKGGASLYVKGCDICKGHRRPHAETPRGIGGRGNDAAPDVFAQAGEFGDGNGFGGPFVRLAA